MTSTVCPRLLEKLKVSQSDTVLILSCILALRALHLESVHAACRSGSKKTLDILEM
jgi:hypothetical protein